MHVKKIPQNAAPVRRANGLLVGWVDSLAHVHDASGNFLGRCSNWTVVLVGWTSDRMLGYVVPGGELHRYDYNDAIGLGLGIGREEHMWETGNWRARPVGRVSSDDGVVTDTNGLVVGKVEVPYRPYDEMAIGTAALILLLRYVQPRRE